MTRVGVETDLYRILDEGLPLVGCHLFFHPRDSRGSRKGWPDYAIATRIGTFYAELKQEGGTVTAEQWAWLDYLRLSSPAFIVAGPWAVEQLLRAVEHAMRPGAKLAPGLYALGRFRLPAGVSPAYAAAALPPVYEQSPTAGPSLVTRCRPGIG